MAKPLDAKAVQMHPAGHIAREWQVRLPAGVSFADIFRPAIWENVEKVMRQRGGGKRPARDDIIRVIGQNFDVQCLVASVSDGYALTYYAGQRPPALAQVLHDLETLPVADASEMKARAKRLRRRWQDLGATRDDLNVARRRFAQQSHPDTHAVDGQRLAAANAILDAALASLQEAA